MILDKRSNDASTCSWVTVELAKISLASTNAFLNSFATIGTSLSRCSWVTWLARSTAICNLSLFVLILIGSCLKIVPFSIST